MVAAIEEARSSSGSGTIRASSDVLAAMKLLCDILDSFRTIDEDPENLLDHLSVMYSEAADAATEERPSSLPKSGSGTVNGSCVIFGFEVRSRSTDLSAAAFLKGSSTLEDSAAPVLDWWMEGSLDPPSECPKGWSQAKGLGDISSS